MLDAARSKANQAGVKIPFYRLDMRNFHLDRTFATIQIPGNSLLHLLSPVEWERCLHAVRRHLAPGGGFCLTFPTGISPLSRGSLLSPPWSPASPMPLARSNSSKRPPPTTLPPRFDPSGGISPRPPSRIAARRNTVYAWLSLRNPRARARYVSEFPARRPPPTPSSRCRPASPHSPRPAPKAPSRRPCVCRPANLLRYA